MVIITFKSFGYLSKTKSSCLLYHDCHHEEAKHRHPSKNEEENSICLVINDLPLIIPDEVETQGGQEGNYAVAQPMEGSGQRHAFVSQDLG
jgi:hypothetical protein